uniref:LOW QUALITY PROTEIN: melanoma inhibitory activity protein 2-like n=1 Tax=Ictidomys tridecemlineatus TaxID=43179 RepID=UPI001A9F3536|nr:LOW QUALITY PROTEIN: melanoma inhibitory activity protein 2-like [Ictidomys tridecemlineatus]
MHFQDDMWFHPRPKNNRATNHGLKPANTAPHPYMGVVLEEVSRVVCALSEDMETHPSPYGWLWELVICTAIGFFVVLLFLWRSYQPERSGRYMRIEEKFALKLSRLIEERCELLEKVSLVQKEYEGLESSLKDAILVKESIEAENFEAIYENLDRSISKLEDEILLLEKEVKEKKTKQSQQDELMVDISKRIKFLEDESESLSSQILEAKTAFRLFQMNEEEITVAIKATLNENSQLQESQKQLLYEAEVWKEKVNGLNKQKTTLEDSKVQVEQVLRDKENHNKSLTEHLLQMEDWASVFGEVLTDYGNLELEMKNVDAHLED